MVFPPMRSFQELQILNLIEDKVQYEKTNKEFSFKSKNYSKIPKFFKRRSSRSKILNNSNKVNFPLAS